MVARAVVLVAVRLYAVRICGQLSRWPAQNNHQEWM